MKQKMKREKISRAEQMSRGSPRREKAKGPWPPGGPRTNWKCELSLGFTLCFKYFNIHFLFFCYQTLLRAPQKTEDIKCLNRKKNVAAYRAFSY